MALWIQNVTDDSFRRDDEPENYAVRINQDPPLATFKHLRSLGAAACLRDAADAIDAAQGQKVTGAAKVYSQIARDGVVAFYYPQLSANTKDALAVLEGARLATHDARNIFAARYVILAAIRLHTDEETTLAMMAKAYAGDQA